jgi:Skp family chaperone for outer membrane proteins
MRIAFLLGTALLAVSSAPAAAIDFGSEAKHRLYVVRDGDLVSVDAETELQAIQKELAKLEAQIAELKKKAGPLRVKVAEAKMARAVDEVVQEARGQYSRNPKKALELLRDMIAEVWDNPQITEGARDALLIRLVTARGELAKK